MARFLKTSELGFQLVGDWAVTNCSLLPNDGSDGPPNAQGMHSAKVTATAGGDVTLTLNRFIPVIATRLYLSGFWVAMGATFRAFLAGINFYDSLFASISSPTGPTLISGGSTTWFGGASIRNQAAPAGAVWAKPFYRIQAMTAGQPAWVGGAVFAEVERPWRLHNAPSSAWMSRKARSSLLQTTGVRDVNELKVVQRQDGPNLSVDVLAGSAYVPGTDVVQQGAYYVENDATENQPLSPADAINPRYTSIFAKVVDAQFSTDLGPPQTNSWGIVAVDGAPSYPFPSAPLTPASSIRLADVLVTPKAQVILDANIIDKRPLFQTQGPQIYTLDGSQLLIQGGIGPWIQCDGQGVFFLPYPTPFPNKVISVIVNDTGGGQPVDAGWATWAHGTIRVVATNSQNRAGLWGRMRFGNNPYTGQALLDWTALGT